MVLDITEQQAAKNRLKIELLHAQKMESIGTLAGGIAHDFNNLLTVVLGFSELMLTDKDRSRSGLWGPSEDTRCRRQRS